MEIWRDVAGYEGLYQVSNFGRVKSFWFGRVRILKPGLARSYPCVDLCRDGKHKKLLVHRLVAQAFIPNPEGKSEVNHINGIKTDNRVENLEWATSSENRQHAYDTGLRPSNENDCHAKLTNEQVRYIRENPDGLNTRELSEMFSVSDPTISNIQIGKTYKSAGGTIHKPKRPRVPDDIREQIRKLYVKGSRELGSRALARRFGIDNATILNIVKEGDKA